MYAVSDAFHDAVKNGNHQMALMIFDDAVFTNADIDVEEGIEFNDYFNLEKNLEIGQTPSNEITFSLFNDYRYLNNYKFGEFTALLGVYLSTDRYAHQGNAYVRTKHATYIGQGEQPYMLRNGSAVSGQPDFPVASILAYNDLVWAFSNDGRYAVYNDASGANVTAGKNVNAFMRAKSKTWAGYGFYYNKSSRMLMIYQDGSRERYEFCPLGHFIAERPNAPDVNEISLTCYDLMQKFDEDMPEDTDLGISYPITAKNLLKKLCDRVGIPLQTTSFINDGMTLSERPEDFDNATMRTVVGWIAEVAASNARINRDGKLVLDWVRETSQSLDENSYSDFEVYWYQTKKVTKLYNRDSDGETEETIGSGSEGYLIQDNPFLR